MQKYNIAIQENGYYCMLNKRADELIRFNLSKTDLLRMACVDAIVDMEEWISSSAKLDEEDIATLMANTGHGCSKTTLEANLEAMGDAIKENTDIICVQMRFKTPTLKSRYLEILQNTIAIEANMTEYKMRFGKMTDTEIELLVNKHFAVPVVIPYYDLDKQNRYTDTVKSSEYVITITSRDPRILKDINTYILEQFKFIDKDKSKVSIDRLLDTIVLVFHIDSKYTPQISLLMT